MNSKYSAGKEEHGMDYLMLIDRFTPLAEDFENTIVLEDAGGKLLEKQAAGQCRLMLSAAKADGVNIKLLSGYRSREYQQTLWHKSISALMGSGMSYQQAVAETGKTLALPGCSEHNSGLAADLATEHADDTEDDFYSSPQGRWLCKNAARFGFILRYPRMKEHITGISYEPWHYRYVGSEAAGFIRSGGLCLEEFLHYYSENFI